MLATALVASVADPSTFRSARNFSAWIGLVPRQYSSGGKERLGSISKQGARAIRTIVNEALAGLEREFAVLYSPIGRPSIPPEKLLRAAVERAARLAQPGDTVLLSPACASLDMFRDYAHRGNVFADAVRRCSA